MGTNIKKQLDEILSRYTGESGDLTPILQEAQATEVWPQRLEGLLAAKGELKSIRGGDARRKKLCPK